MARLIAPVVLAFLLFAPAAWAAPPPNDERADAQRLGALPATARGTTAEATNEPTEPFSCAGTTGGSVWYSLPPAAARELVLELDAAGDMDAAVDVYRRDRSQVTSIACGQTDRRGRLTLDFDQPRNAELLIRIAPRANSVADAFTLRVVAPDAPERPPGRPLGPSGAAGSVDRVANPDDAYAVSLAAGRSYRVNLVSRERCVTAALYPPGTRAFRGGNAVRTFSCDAYFLFTPGPGEGGRYSVRVQAPRSRRGALPYHVQVARAGADDTAPGLELANDVRVRGTLHGGGADVLDLYRFEVRRPSILDLRLSTGAETPLNLQLLRGGGKRVACACGDTGSQQVRLRLRPGRFFAVVRARRGASGSYRLSRLTRTITRTRVLIDGARSARIRPGGTATIGVRVAPGAAGPVTIDIERFDPLAGWQFYERHSRRASGGLASMAFRPPAEGRWRVRAAFDGTRVFAPSGPSQAALLVAEPLRG